MSIIVIGSNRIENCENLIAKGVDSVLQVDLDPVRIDLVLPDEASHPLVIRRNEVIQGDVRLIDSPQDVSVVSDEGHLVCNVTQLEPGYAAVHLDLRPFGVLIFTDAQGLHVGDSLLAGNTIQGAKTAIALG